jgi:hypothetical protein
MAAVGSPLRTSGSTEPWVRGRNRQDLISSSPSEFVPFPRLPPTTRTVVVNGAILTSRAAALERIKALVSTRFPRPRASGRMARPSMIFSAGVALKRWTDLPRRP